MSGLFVNGRYVRSRRLMLRAGASILAACGGWMICASAGHAATETVLHNFTGAPDGVQPFAGVVFDGQGNLYGTTVGGGANSKKKKISPGTVYRIAPNGTYTVLVSFSTTGAVGYGPTSDLLRGNDGLFYGATSSGGANGTGTIFSMTASGTTQVVYAKPAGSADILSLAQDLSGNLYGAYGIPFQPQCPLFQVTLGGTFTILPGAPVCANPYLVVDGAGTIFGTSQGDGAYGQGTVFKLTQAGTYTDLHDFGGSGDPGGPYGLTMDPSGNLWGTTWQLGTMNFGTIFKIDTSGTETVVHSFACGTDGGSPIAPLLSDASGNIYGTDAEFCPKNKGAAYKIAPNGTFTPLFQFTKKATGYAPMGLLALDGAGNVYGAAGRGGSKKDGLVFKLNP